MVVGMTQLYESIRNTKWEGPSLLLEHHGYRSCMFESQSVFFHHITWSIKRYHCTPAVLPLSSLGCSNSIHFQHLYYWRVFSMQRAENKISLNKLNQLSEIRLGYWWIFKYVPFSKCSYFLNLCDRLLQIFPSVVTVTEHRAGSSSVNFGVLLLVMAPTWHACSGPISV